MKKTLIFAAAFAALSLFASGCVSSGAGYISSFSETGIASLVPAPDPEPSAQPTKGPAAGSDAPHEYEPAATPVPTEAPQPSPPEVPVPSSFLIRGPLVPESDEAVYLDMSWKYADYSAIHSGNAVLYYARADRKEIVVGVNAGHGTSGGGSVRTLCHPDGSPKTTGGTTAAGNTTAPAVSSGMTFSDGTPEAAVTLQMAIILRDHLLAEGYDVLMLRTGPDVQLDNIARTVICNNRADCHIALHWDGDGLGYDKGAFYMSVPDAIKNMEPVAGRWPEHEALGDSLIAGLRQAGVSIWEPGYLDTDLTQTSYSTVPSVDIELGNQSSVHDDETLRRLAEGLVSGINAYFGQ